MGNLTLSVCESKNKLEMDIKVLMFDHVKYT